MRTEKKRWRPSAPLIVTLTAMAVVAGMPFLGWINARRYWVRARVEIAEPMIEAQTAQVNAAGNTIHLPDGEVARTAARVREATAILMGLTMLAVTEQMNHRSAVNSASIVELMARRSLLPPGVHLTPTGCSLVSELATICVRFRPAPLGLEVISVPTDRASGPALIARLAAGGDDESGAVLLMAKKADGAIPGPFASASEIIAANWNVEPLRERQFSPQEMSSLAAWAQQYAGK